MVFLGGRKELGLGIFKLTYRDETYTHHEWLGEGHLAGMKG